MSRAVIADLSVFFVKLNKSAIPVLSKALKILKYFAFSFILCACVVKLLCQIFYTPVCALTKLFGDRYEENC